jgi:hypothetical protein
MTAPIKKRALNRSSRLSGMKSLKVFLNNELRRTAGSSYSGHAVSPHSWVAVVAGAPSGIKKFIS